MGAIEPDKIYNLSELWQTTDINTGSFDKVTEPVTLEADLLVRAWGKGSARGAILCYLITDDSQRYVAFAWGKQYGGRDTYLGARSIKNGTRVVATFEAAVKGKGVYLTSISPFTAPGA